MLIKENKEFKHGVELKLTIYNTNRCSFILRCLLYNIYNIMIDETHKYYNNISKKIHCDL